MAEIGVRELKTHASQIIREVWQQHARYVVTYRGRPVGLLVPLDAAAPAELLPSDESKAQAWEELSRLGEEIGRGWPGPQTSAESLSEMRR